MAFNKDFTSTSTQYRTVDPSTLTRTSSDEDGLQPSTTTTLVDRSPQWSGVTPFDSDHDLTANQAPLPIPNPEFRLERNDDESGANGLARLRRAAAAQRDGAVKASADLNEPLQILARARERHADGLDLIDARVG